MADRFMKFNQMKTFTMKGTSESLSVRTKPLCLMVNILLPFCLLLAVPDIHAQGSVSTFKIPLPANVCECSTEEMNNYKNKISEALSVVESWYTDTSLNINEDSLKSEAWRQANLSLGIDTLLQDMSPAEQQAYALKMAQMVASKAMTSATADDQEKIKQQQMKAADNRADFSTIQELLLPVGIDLDKLEKEADDWYLLKIRPLYDTLNLLYEDEYNAMYRRIIEAEKSYCRKFSPRQLELIKRQVEALEKAFPAIQDLLARNIPVKDASNQFKAKELDPVWLYLKAIEKSFDYRIHNE